MTTDKQETPNYYDIARIMEAVLYSQFQNKITMVITQCTGATFLDIKYKDDTIICVLEFDKIGISTYSSCQEEGLTNASHEYYNTPNEAIQRITHLIISGEKTVGSF